MNLYRDVTELTDEELRELRELSRTLLDPVIEKYGLSAAALSALSFACAAMARLRGMDVMEGAEIARRTVELWNEPLDDYT